MGETTYGEMIDNLVDEMAKYDDRATVFRRNDIPKGHFYNVINPNRTTSSGNPFYTPVEWMVKLTRDAKNFTMIKKVGADCGCLVITPDEIEKLKEAKPEETIELFQSILGMINGKK